MVASLFCIHGGAECWLRNVVMELCRQGGTRSCSVSGGKALNISVLTSYDETNTEHFQGDEESHCDCMTRVCSPCSPTVGSFVVLSTHRSTADAAPQYCVWTDGWALAQRWLCREAEWMAVCRLEQEPSLSELLKPLLWNRSNFSYSTRTQVMSKQGLWISQ